MSKNWTAKAGVSGVAAAFFAVLVVAAFAFPNAALAAENTPISGSTYSSSDVWYLSATFRTVTLDDGGYISINIDSAPKKRNGSADYLKWRIYITPNNGPVKTVNQDPNDWTNLGYYGPPGTQFRNRFARGTTCNNCNHDFSGNMTY